MSLPGGVSVSPTGAANYVIPLAIPPGTGGLAPSLSLNYSSQKGNGLLGIGWGLGGLSAIDRCPRTLAQDGVSGGVRYDTNDRFCLSGQRLVAVSGAYGADGAEYRTEIDSYSKVVSHGGNGNGPSWFEVHTKSGQVLEYGNTPDSQILAQASNVARVWALNKVSDSNSNSYTVTYTNDRANGQFYPSRIDYAGNGAAGVAPYNSVQFAYQSRPDVVSQYQAGSLVKSTVVLSDIRTYSESNLVSIYSLRYQLSPSTGRIELSSVTLCDSGGTCLPATTFGWQAGASNGSLAGSVQRLPNDWSWDRKITNACRPPLVTGDFNGDGKTDYLLIDCTGRPATYVFMANGDGTFSGKVQGIANGWGFDYTPHADPITGITKNCIAPPISVGDFNGDGKTDFVVIDCWGGSFAYIFISNGDGSFAGHAQNLNGWRWDLKNPNNCVSPPLVDGDFNGDGRADFLLVDCMGSSAQYVFISNGDGSFTTQQQPLPNQWRFVFTSDSRCTKPPFVVGDFNGDGKTDYLFLDCAGASAQYVAISNGDGTFSGQTQQTPNQWGFHFDGNCRTPLIASGDFNGDGNSDFAVIDCTGQPFQYVFTSKGDGSFTGQAQQLPNGWRFNLTDTSLTAPPLVVGDFNADGKTDYAVIDTWGHQVQYAFLNTGDGTFTGQQQMLPNGASFSTPASFIPVVGDFNGDGRSEHLLITQDGFPFQDVYISVGPVGDLINSISTGVGSQISLSYLPLTDSGVYSKDANAAYPAVDVQQASYVVSRVDSSNGIGGVYSSTYSYVGAKMDLTGRGALGFRQVIVSDLQTGIVGAVSYRQDYPLVGLLSSSSKAIGSATLGQVTNSYQFSNNTGQASVAPSASPYRVNLVQSVTGGGDLDGSPFPTVTTSSQYDPYGNPTVVTVLSSDGFSKTSANTYLNDPTLWYIGRLTRSVVTSVSP
ncbi:hypothetical protein HL666_27630 [Bradyrhizobium sp. 83002]|uniref:FG-GAP-like repeat-containing protein n=1 Tax=Bradyrhizobium aeschynomenes TaxID=2734909 RepID=UPI0015544F52|nr:FG-GAP-like repeat-containing protein [Bradyrhizobium aeschynomenes]NPU14549.1 hypothetical protein [Bradyrhizobium aeschynomenes]